VDVPLLAVRGTCRRAFEKKKRRGLPSQEKEGAGGEASIRNVLKDRLKGAAARDERAPRELQRRGRVVREARKKGAEITKDIPTLWGTSPRARV